MGAAIRVSPASSSRVLSSVVLVSGAVLGIAQTVTVYAGLVEGVDDDPHHDQHDEITQPRGGLAVVTVVARVVAAALLTAEPAPTPTATVFLLTPALLGELQGVLQAAGAGQDEVVLRVVVTLTDHLHPPKPHPAFQVRLALPLDLLAVPASVVALDHAGLVTSASPTATNTG